MRSHAVLLAFLAIGLGLALTYTPRRWTDTALNSAQTHALTFHGDVDLGRYKINYGFIRVRDGHTYSIYGVGVSFVALPVYAPMIRMGISASQAEGAVSILYVAAAGAALFAFARRRYSPRVATLGTIALVFGTTMWPIASTGFWQHAPVAFFQTLGLCNALDADRRSPVFCGLALGVATFVRPTQAVFLLAVGAVYALRNRADAAHFTLGAAIPIAAILVQNRWIWGSWLEGGYSQVEVAFNGSIGPNLWGELFGWWRGLFIYSPVLLLATIGVVLALRARRRIFEFRLATIAAASVVLILTYARWDTWHGGSHQFGNRYLLDITPPAVLLLMYVVASWRRAWGPAMVLTALSVAIMALGSQPNADGWDPALFPTRLADTPIARAWKGAVAHPLRPLSTLLLVASVTLALFLLAQTIPHEHALEEDGAPT